MKLRMIAVGLFCWGLLPLEAESEYAEHHRNQEGLPESSVEVRLGMASNHVDRGEDEYKDVRAQKGQSYGSFTVVPTFQSAITFHTPLKGLYFEVETEMAMTHRTDRDVDHRIQASPGGGPNVWTDAYAESAISGATLPAAGTAANLALLSAMQGNLWPAAPVSNAQVYKPYAEHNGLARKDEAEFVVGYDTSTRLGDFGFGILNKAGVGPKSKSNPFTNGGADESYRLTEIFLSYSLPFLPQLNLRAGSDIVNSNQYYQLTYANDIDVTRDFEITFEGGPAYAVEEQVQGWHDVTGRIGVQYRGFSAGVNGAWRPDLRFMDEDDPLTTAPVQWDGGSTRGDGRVPDPSRNNGFYQDVVNSFVTQAVRSRTGNQNYRYTPRQRIPRMLYWVDVSYTVEL